MPTRDPDPGASGARGALGAITGALRCPVCAEPVEAGDGRLRCDRGHSFDLARQGYVSLASGRAGPGTGDSAAMVAARERFLGGGHYQPVADAVTGLAQRPGPGAGGSGADGSGADGSGADGSGADGSGAGGSGAGADGAGDRGAPAGRGLVLDLAGGTGYYLARVLDALPGRLGACLDLSAPALRRAARAHPRAAAVGADAWRRLPLADGCAALVLSVFGPRNAGESRRVLAPGGRLILVSPAPDHHRELRAALGLIGIDERKSARLAESHAGFGTPEVTAVRYQLRLGHADLTDLVAMGPSARHVAPDELARRVAALPAPVTVTVDVTVRSYRA